MSFEEKKIVLRSNKAVKLWTKEETLGFLKCYAARRDEFEFPRRKKFGYANVLEDMLFNGLTDSNTTVAHLERKMKTLLKAYKTAQNNSKQTGAAYSCLPYMKEMDELFGGWNCNNDMIKKYKLDEESSNEMYVESVEFQDLIEDEPREPTPPLSSIERSLADVRAGVATIQTSLQELCRLMAEQNQELRRFVTDSRRHYFVMEKEMSERKRDRSSNC